MKLKNRFIIVLVILAIVAGGASLFFREGTLPVDKNEKSTKIFVIAPGENLNEIDNKLHKEGLIRNRLAFYLVIKQRGIEKKIQAGDFRLSPSFNAYQIADNLTRGSLDTWITFIEGQRKEEYAELLSQELGIPETEFIQAADEGYLFPDTYLIPKHASASAVVAILANNFNTKLSAAKNQSPQKNELLQDEVVTLASLVEREARLDEDRLRVANILLRRITEGHKLQVDATVQYALGYQVSEKRWWKSHTTFNDLEVDSLYNTYANPGLPPSPIANPGLASLTAALQATGKTPYLFYVSDRNGKLHFAKDGNEHQKNIETYLN